MLWVATVETSRWVSAIPHSHHQISQPDLRNSTSHPNLRVYPISIILRTLPIIPIDSKRLPKPLSEQSRHTLRPVFFLLTKRTTLSPPSPVALTATACSLRRCCPRLALKRIFNPGTLLYGCTELRPSPCLTSAELSCLPGTRSERSRWNVPAGNTDYSRRTQMHYRAVSI